MSILKSWSIGGLVALAIVSLAIAPQAHAQGPLTPEILIGDSVAEPNASKYSDIDEAIKRFDGKDVLGARTFLERAVSKDDKLPPVDVMLAKMHFVTGNVQAGLAALDAAVRDIRTDPEPYLLLADQARSTGQSISALALYDKGIELTEAYDANPKRKRRFMLRAYSGRAAVLQQWEDWVAAEADLQVLLKEDPDDAAALSRLGVVYFMLDKPAEGYNSFVKARELNKDLAPPYVAAATMYQRLGKPDQARQAFERAYAENKADKATLVAYAQWLLQTDQIDQAKTVLAGARKEIPNSFEILLLSGLAERMSGELDAAEQLYMQALAIQPTNRDVYNQLALLLFDQDNTEKKQRGAGFAQANASIHQSNADVLITLAWVMYKLGRVNEFNEAYQRGVRAGALSPDSKYLIAKIMVDQKRNDVAEKLLTNASDDYQGIFVMKNEAQALLESIK